MFYVYCEQWRLSCRLVFPGIMSGLILPPLCGYGLEIDSFLCLSALHGSSHPSFGITVQSYTIVIVISA